MYWFELSVDDMKQKANEFRLQDQEQSESSNPSSFDKNLAVLNEYKTQSLDSFYQRTGLTPERITTIKGYYTKISTYFDNFCDVAYRYMCQFREITKDIAVLKTIYQAYDQILMYKKNLETIRSLHKLSRDMQSTFGGSMNKDQTNDTDTSDKKDQDPMKMMDQMFSNIKPEDMDKMMASINPDDMNQMMQQMFGGNLAKLVGDMEGMLDSQAKPTKKKIKRK
jgi:hypothetical protein